MSRCIKLCSMVISIGAVTLMMLSDVQAQCSGGRGGGTSPRMTGSSTPLLISNNSPNAFGYQQALLQRQAIYASQNRMYQQRQQLIALQRQRSQQMLDQQYAQQQQIQEMRFARAEAKRARRAERIAANLAKRQSLQSDGTSDSMLAATAPTHTLRSFGDASLFD